MKKSILLFMLFLVLFISQSRAQTFNTYSTFPGGTMYGHLDSYLLYGNPNEFDDVFPDYVNSNTTVTNVSLIVWATGDQGDWIDLINSSGPSYASGNFNYGLAIAAFPGEVFTLHYIWSCDYHDYFTNTDYFCWTTIDY